MSRKTLPRFSKAEFASRLSRDAPPLGAEALERIYRHWCELARWTPSHALIGAGTYDDAIRRHYAESLAALPLLVGGELLDIGSGAGFPGLVLAAAMPELSVTLVEPRGRKATFLRRASRVAGIGCRVLQDRIGPGIPADLPERIDFVTSRAVRLTDNAWQALRPHLAPDVRVLLWCGPAELAAPPSMTLDAELAFEGSNRRICLYVSGAENAA